MEKYIRIADNMESCRHQPGSTGVSVGIIENLEEYSLA